MIGIKKLDMPRFSFGAGEKSKRNLPLGACMDNALGSYPRYAVRFRRGARSSKRSTPGLRLTQEIGDQPR